MKRLVKSLFFKSPGLRIGTASRCFVFRRFVRARPEHLQGVDSLTSKTQLADCSLGSRVRCMQWGVKR